MANKVMPPRSTTPPIVVATAPPRRPLGNARRARARNPIEAPMTAAISPSWLSPSPRSWTMARSVRSSPTNPNAPIASTSVPMPNAASPMTGARFATVGRRRRTRMTRPRPNRTPLVVACRMAWPPPDDSPASPDDHHDEGRDEQPDHERDVSAATWRRALREIHGALPPLRPPAQPIVARGRYGLVTGRCRGS